MLTLTENWARFWRFTATALLKAVHRLVTGAFSSLNCVSSLAGITIFCIMKSMRSFRALTAASISETTPYASVEEQKSLAWRDEIRPLSYSEQPARLIIDSIIVDALFGLASNQLKRVILQQNSRNHRPVYKSWRELNALDLNDYLPNEFLAGRLLDIAKATSPAEKLWRTGRGYQLLRSFGIRGSPLSGGSNLRGRANGLQSLKVGRPHPADPPRNQKALSMAGKIRSHLTAAQSLLLQALVLNCCVARNVLGPLQHFKGCFVHCNC